MKKWILAVTLAALPLSSATLAQSKDVLVGTWKLISFVSTTDKGQVKDSMGQKPTGFITCTPEGRMSVVITAEARKPLSVNDRVSAPAEERAEAFATLIAYAGRYTFTGDKITHHVEASWMPNQVGTNLVRSVKLKDDRSNPANTAYVGGRRANHYRVSLAAPEIGPGECVVICIFCTPDTFTGSSSARTCFCLRASGRRSGLPPLFAKGAPSASRMSPQDIRGGRAPLLASRNRHSSLSLRYGSTVSRFSVSRLAASRVTSHAPNGL
jgi:hypothetical protein